MSEVTRANGMCTECKSSSGEEHYASCKFYNDNHMKSNGVTFINPEPIPFGGSGGSILCPDCKHSIYSHQNACPYNPINMPSPMPLPETEYTSVKKLNDRISFHKSKLRQLQEDVQFHKGIISGLETAHSILCDEPWEMK